MLFDRVAEDYDRMRPEYPAALIDQAFTRAELRPGSRVVDVGCGTGKLTAGLAKRGLTVEAIDPGRQLVELARRRMEGQSVTFHICRFEDAELPSGAFDAVLSATAFHWVDPAVGWSRAANLLRPNGLLALLSHVGGPHLELDEAFVAAWRDVLPEAASWISRDANTLWEGAEARRGNVSEVWAWLTKQPIERHEAAELFTDVQIDTISIDRTETTAEALALTRTTSAYLRLDDQSRRKLETRLSAVLDSAGGVLRYTTFAVLVTARVTA
jgi:ubiquinone/menaquinone biosynthesis C-methylase UbiE